MTSPHVSPSLDEIATAVLEAIAPMGHPVAERYVRSMRSIRGSGLEAKGDPQNGPRDQSVYGALDLLSPRERDLACLRDATATAPRFEVDWLAADLSSATPLRCWATLILAARTGQLSEVVPALAAVRASEGPLTALMEVADRLTAPRTVASSSTEPAPTKPVERPAPVAAAPLQPAPKSPAPAPAEPAPEPTPRPAEQPSGDDRPLALQVSELEASARKTGDPTARAALYYRIGRLHEDRLGAPRSALESYLLAFMLDPRSDDHFVAVERACIAAERHKDLVHIYQSGVEAIDEGAYYAASRAELLWRCKQVQSLQLLRGEEAEHTAARLAVEPSASPELLSQLLNWLQGRVPRNEALIALVASRLPAP